MSRLHWLLTTGTQWQLAADLDECRLGMCLQHKVISGAVLLSHATY